MSTRKTTRLIAAIVGLLLLASLFAGCTLGGIGDSAEGELPPTPTIAIPMITIEATEVVEEIETIIVETEPPAEEAEADVMEKEVAEEEVVEEEELVEADAVSPTATPIPPNDSANPDATVYIYADTYCYDKAESTSAIVGTAKAYTALGALDRDGNWYRINHPTKGGWLCWVTGSGISPNQAAYDLD
ncbi:MAG: hypothetical protein JW750_05810 [Anaerolineaceae bacterium]|nr:hypothetical protein [Anaerolineaceae bacterium]